MALIFSKHSGNPYFRCSIPTLNHYNREDWVWVWALPCFTDPLPNPKVLSIAVMDTMTKDNVGRETFILAYSLSFVMKERKLG